MILKPQDVLVALKFAALAGHDRPSFAALAEQLGMSPSEVHAAVKRLLQAGLLRHGGDATVRPAARALQEFLVHGAKYVFIPERGPMARGVPTAHAAPPLDSYFADSDEPPPVWPDPDGAVRGATLEPIYRSAPQAAGRDPVLYELLVLVDALRAGRARERKLAAELLETRLKTRERALA